MFVSPEEAKELYDDRIEQPRSAFSVEYEEDGGDMVVECWNIKEQRVIWLYPLQRTAGGSVPLIEKRVTSTITYDVCTCYDQERATELLAMLRNREKYTSRTAR